jgi:hypothetical protein
MASAALYSPMSRDLRFVIKGVNAE